MGDNAQDDSTAQPGAKRVAAAALVPVPAVLLALGLLSTPAVAAAGATAAPSHDAKAASAATLTTSHVQTNARVGNGSFATLPVPALDPVALGGLVALVAWFGARSKRD